MIPLEEQRPARLAGRRGANASAVGTGDSAVNGSTCMSPRNLEALLAERLDAPDRGSPTWMRKQAQLLDELARAREAEAEQRLHDLQHRQVEPRSAPRPLPRAAARPREHRAPAVRPARTATAVLDRDDDGDPDDDPAVPLGFYSVLTFGRFEGRTVGEVVRRHRRYARWLLANVPMRPDTRRALVAAIEFYSEQEVVR